MTTKSGIFLQKQAKQSKITIEIKDLYPQARESIREPKRLDASIAEDSDGSD